MARKPAKLEFGFVVDFVPVPAERAGLLLLLEILKSEEPIDIAEVDYERVGVDSLGDDQRRVVALFSLEEAVEGQRTSANSSVRAWHIGFDGPVQSLVVGARKRSGSSDGA